MQLRSLCEINLSKGYKSKKAKGTSLKNKNQNLLLKNYR